MITQSLSNAYSTSSKRDSARMSQESISTSVTIAHPLGLHLRVGKDVVKVANQYRAAITAENLSRPSPVVDVKSILQLMQLQAREGHKVRLTADGPDAAEALDAVSRLFITPISVD
jgi:phosphotransferase system HPr (HPr) family protein